MLPVDVVHVPSSTYKTTSTPHQFTQNVASFYPEQLLIIKGLANTFTICPNSVNGRFARPATLFPTSSSKQLNGSASTLCKNINGSTRTE